MPTRSLLSRLTDHYLQIIANCAPIGFEAEYVNRRGVNTLYRGILMPLSSDGEAIDYIYGVINWKELADSRISSELALAVDRAVAAAPAPGDCPVWADGPNAEIVPSADVMPPVTEDESGLGLWAAADERAEAAAIEDDAGLADRLSAARQSAEAARGADHRSRGALYRALGDAYDFALAAEAEPADYAELLGDAGLKAQSRAPMTPVVKLVFGAGYDKTRLTEFATALSWARRQAVPKGRFATVLEGHAGGLKAVVGEERKARRPAPAPDPIDAARARLRAAPAAAFVEIEVDAPGEFVLLVARREPDGRMGIVAALADEAITDRAIRKVAA